MKKFLYLFFILLSFLAHSQQNVSISDVPSTPNPTSVLDVSSTSKGMLIPRMTTLQRNAIVGPANGLLVYDINVNCIMFYSSTTANWNSLCTSTNLTNLVANTSTLSAGANCAFGGILLEIGSDTNSNGTLDASEVTSSQSICNGQTGPAGATGATGLTGPAGPAGATGATGLT
ncbi:MAG: hypothetical protein RL037_1400, partial [Bacteroidota bacterium]